MAGRQKAFIILTNPTSDVSFSLTGVTAEMTELCFRANTAGSTIELIKVGSPSAENYQYSYDRISWINFTLSETVGTNTITLINVNDKVYFRGTISGDFSWSNYLRFVMTGSISASGNINSLYTQTNYNSLTTLTYRKCYYKIFYDCTALITPPALPATTLASDCYYNMFNGCTSLALAPELPATTLTDSCYNSMFSNCTSLIAAPDLPATTLAQVCYMQMFYNCSSLTTPPDLPATNLTYGCYWSMFSSCSSLTTAPALSATTLANYCYYYMFSGCTSLTTAPALSAMTLASNCYSNMFNGCTALVNAPALPATTLASECYLTMFYNCTSLYVSDTQITEAPYAWNIPSSGTFANTTTYNQKNMFTNCLGTRSSSDMSGALGESHTYYTQNQPV